ncbi:uncharacterized protein LOC103314530 [Tribolium castaneum]|uniref:Uncharacterized protein n=1 Tax=Tribolium castaneum TaxID=7070 RepID=A0A139WAS1_TRICA|nr:PREDICTED: uncharacterized protein LOC103314530 [Tribolium castaneum]KYB24991.1 hypothetical protein TcasGA2_TC031423 [Tribolium castaneum]|eukprot:XP_008199093.1 PREDICTED: uncharacterized protein LOC103314530 [Tribolium castaneum]
MSTPTSIDDLKSDFVIGVSVVGGVCVLLTCAVIGLFVWNLRLYRKIQKLDPFVNFKLQRPKKVNNDQQQRQPTTFPSRDDFVTVYDNSGFERNKEERRNLNPIALRSKASFDNENFSFGSNKLSLNSFRQPDYLHLDNRFY